jgi:hypothetical protein
MKGMPFKTSLSLALLGGFFCFPASATQPFSPAPDNNLFEAIRLSTLSLCAVFNCNLVECVHTAAFAVDCRPPNFNLMTTT